MREQRSGRILDPRLREPLSPAGVDHGAPSDQPIARRERRLEEVHREVGGEQGHPVGQRGEHRAGEGGIGHERHRAAAEHAGGRPPPWARGDRPRGGAGVGFLDDEAAQMRERWRGQLPLDEEPELLEARQGEQPRLFEVGERAADRLIDDHPARIPAPVRPLPLLQTEPQLIRGRLRDRIGQTGAPPPPRDRRRGSRRAPRAARSRARRRDRPRPRRTRTRDGAPGRLPPRCHRVRGRRQRRASAPRSRRSACSGRARWPPRTGPTGRTASPSTRSRRRPHAGCSAPGRAGSAESAR